jgi:mannose PTS system EIIA component
MTRLILVAHEPLASALGEVARHVYPGCAAQLICVDIASAMSLEQAAAHVSRAVLAGREGVAGEHADPEVLFLVDTPGATPCKASVLAAEAYGAKVVSGVNVPMLWRTLCYASESAASLLDRALQGGVRGVLEVVPESSAAMPVSAGTTKQT